MAKFAVTVYETRTYTINLEASDADEARVNAVTVLETLGPFEPDNIEISPEDVWVERK